MKYNVVMTPAFQRDYRKLKRQGKNITPLHTIVARLASGAVLPSMTMDYGFFGTWTGYRECIIRSDLRLIYHVEEETGTLTLARTGLRDELFRKLEDELDDHFD